MKSISRNQGFMRIVLLAIVLIALMGYFNIDLRAFFESPIVQKIANIFIVAWVTYLKPLFVYLYTSISSLFH